jgi:hypothetical protein
MSTPLDTIQSVFFQKLKDGMKPIVFSMKTTTTVLSLHLFVGKGDTHPNVQVIEDGKTVFGISDDYWLVTHEADDKEVKEEDFPQLVNEYFSKFIGYTVSKCMVKSIDFEGTKFPHCLRIELTKETDSGIDTRVFSIIPTFHPCTFCMADMQINVLYKTGNATIKESLIAYRDDYGTLRLKEKTTVKKNKVKTPRIVNVGDGWFKVNKK